MADLGALFLVIGFAFFNLMLVLQQYARLRTRQPEEKIRT